ncbi:MAG: hypothetical protein RLZZ519_1523 [Bacteroidota bacterium]|jgi:hypothetical protein
MIPPEGLQSIYALEFTLFIAVGYFVLGFLLADYVRKWIGNPFITAHRLMGWPWKLPFRQFPFLLNWFLPLQPAKVAVVSVPMLMLSVAVFSFSGEYGWIWSAPGFILAVANLFVANWARNDSVLLALIATMARILASRYARLADAPTAEKVLGKLLVEDDPKYKVMAVKYLGLVGTPSALATLEGIQFASKAVLAACQEAIKAAKLDPESLPSYSPRALRQKLAVYKSKLRPRNVATLPRAADFDAWMQEMEDEIDQLLRKQSVMKQAPAHVYCMHCHTRAQVVSEVGWWWLECKTCKGYAGLESGVVKAIGVIGPVVVDSITDGEYRLEIWDFRSKNIIPADFDALEITSGGNFDYDWAVGEVVQWLEQRGTGPMPVRIGPEVNLQPNSLRILDRVRKRA